MSFRLLFPLGAGALALLSGRAAAGAAVREAEARPCQGPTLQANAAFRQQFPELLERIGSALPQTQGVDACAKVRLGLTEAGIALEVLLPDGRATVRDVTQAEDVLPTLQALLLVPELEPTPEPTPAAPRSTTEKPAALSHAPTLRGVDRGVTRKPGAAPSENGFELSLVSGARVGDGQYGYGGGVLSFIQLSRWLIGFHGRADGYRSLLGSDPETALALGLLLGRRFPLGSTALDLTAGPALALRGATFGATTEVEAYDSSSAPAPQPMTRTLPGGQAQRDIGPVPRLLLGVRWGFSQGSVFRTFVGVDGELGPRRSDDAAEGFGSSGRMPAYTLGLSLGATLGTR